MPLPTVPQGLYEPVRYMLGGGGKRLRPVLLCASAHAFGVQPDHVRPQALGIEMFHNFTLLHDDVMDNADVRHGRPTVHCKWNVPTAILSGDTMLTLASTLMGECDSDCRADILDLFNRTAIMIYEGQQYDMNFETIDNVTVDEYIEMIRLKTAVLLASACKLGVMLARQPMDVCRDMYEFGELMGLAFQLRDDYLDTYGDEATFGKAIGGDILNDKKTWLRVKASELAGDELHQLSQLEGKEKIKEITALYSRLGVNTMCLDLIAEYTRRAVTVLGNVFVTDSDAYGFFAGLAQSAVKRNS